MSLFASLAGSQPEPPKQDTSKPLTARIVIDSGLTATAGEADVAAILGGFRGAPVQRSGDLTRIIELPRRKLDVTDPAAAAAWTEHLRRRDVTSCDCVERFGFCITQLKPIQGWALEEASNAQGLLGPIGVGHGKEGSCLLAPWAFESKRALLLMPANLRAQFLNRDYPQWSVHFRVPSLAGVSIYPGAPVLHVMSYNDLSRPEKTAALKQLAPDLIILNEAQNLARREAARTKRFLRYMRGEAADDDATGKGRARLFAVSGTLTKTSIKDYAHLSDLALGDGSPLPQYYPTVVEWSELLDAKNGRPAPLGAFKALCEPGEKARDAFRRRLLETEGVVGTSESALDTLLTITERKIETPEHVDRMIDHVRETWERPDGEELVEIIQKANVCKQLASGFYYKWIWPRKEPKETIDRWLKVRKEWHKSLREKLKYGGEGMDSPLLLRRAARRWHFGYSWTDPTSGKRYSFPAHQRRGPLPVWESDLWPLWLEVAPTAKPETEAVWVDDFLARDAAEWARSRKGIVWYQHVVFGERVADLAQAPLYGGGKKASELILTERGNRSIVASSDAHGTGKNLQVFAENLYPNPMTDGAAWEQCLARTHRPGQRAQEVLAHVYRHTEEMRAAIDTAIQRARYIRDTMGGDQKLLYATIDFDTPLDTFGGM